MIRKRVSVCMPASRIKLTFKRYKNDWNYCLQHVLLSAFHTMMAEFGFWCYCQMYHDITQPNSEFHLFLKYKAFDTLNLENIEITQSGMFLGCFESVLTILNPIIVTISVTVVSSLLGQNRQEIGTCNSCSYSTTGIITLGTKEVWLHYERWKLPTN